MFIKKSREYVVYIYKLIKRFPDDEKFAMCNQLRRAAVSITSNIAEGWEGILIRRKSISLSFHLVLCMRLCLKLK